MSAQLHISGLGVAYGPGQPPALSGISFEQRAGESLCIVGESGSGKSTLALAIAGLLPPGAERTGQIGWRDTDRLPRCGSEVGLIFQDPAGSLDPVMSVGRQVAEVAHSAGDLDWPAADLIARELLTDVGFREPGSISGAFAHQLSGGQAQRVAIACALAAKPRLLIADEATNALDTIVQAEIVALLRRLREEQHLSLLFITHDLALARSMAERVLILRRGKTIFDGPFDDMSARPQDEYISRLLSAHIWLDGPRLVERL